MAMNKGKAIARNGVDSPLFKDKNKDVAGFSNMVNPLISNDTEELDISSPTMDKAQSQVITGTKNSWAETKADELDENEEVKHDQTTNASELIEDSFVTNESEGFKMDFITKIQTRSDADMRKKFLSKLTQEKIWLTPSEKPKVHQTCIIFDWDDTLLCTTFLNPSSCGNFDLPLNVKLQLKRLEKAAISILTECMKFGEVYIITNAAEGWVEFSAKKYMPKLLKLFGKLTIMSARA